ncbi:cell surface glycoprotein CD200 receptor 1-B-like isoform X1 [Apteryx mantelli]|uniref:Cell surface glycoprotein CD200 receptor 1-B-like isoform X1 n=2 Tax=Apteryx mantelli TaxID=2696672 RepID=A0A8B7J3M0_9AVES
MAQIRAVLSALLFLLINLVQRPAYNIVNVEAGHEAVLSCPYLFKVPLLMATWKMKSSTYCLLAYRYDNNETRKLNCSERMTWKYSPDSDPALRIYPVNLGDEGNYTCEIVSSEGNFLFLSSLTVIVPPTVTLSSNRSGVAVCQASAGKPAAEISWMPANNHSTEKEVHHPNGTVTRASCIDWDSSMHPTVTCLITHPATNKTLSLNLSYVSLKLRYLLIGGSASIAAVTGAGVILCLVFRCKASGLRKSALEPAAPFATKNLRSTPQHEEPRAVELSVVSECVYQNHNPRIMCMDS